MGESQSSDPWVARVKRKTKGQSGVEPPHSKELQTRPSYCWRRMASQTTKRWSEWFVFSVVARIGMSSGLLQI